jgi:hypothetical protein
MGDALEFNKHLDYSNLFHFHYGFNVLNFLQVKGLLEPFE